MQRAALWIRVSTSDQVGENQADQLRSWAATQGYEVVREFSLEESAFNGKHRAQLDQALQAARIGEFDVMLVWALDRLTREGAEAVLKLFRQFREQGVRVISLQEPWADAAGEAGDVLVAMMGWLAQQHSRRLSERVKAGLERRRRENKPVGRQPGAKDKRKRKRSGYVARWERERVANQARS